MRWRRLVPSTERNLGTDADPRRDVNRVQSPPKNLSVTRPSSGNKKAPAANSAAGDGRDCPTRLPPAKALTRSRPFTRPAPEAVRLYASNTSPSHDGWTTGKRVIRSENSSGTDRVVLRVGRVRPRLRAQCDERVSASQQFRNLSNRWTAIRLLRRRRSPEGRAYGRARPMSARNLTAQQSPRHIIVTTAQ